MELTDLNLLRQEIDAFLWPEVDGKQRLKRERILLAATDLFVRLGYRKTSVDQIARQAGVAKGTVYLYYRNKAEIVYHALALEKHNHLDRLAKPLTDPALAPPDQLKMLIALGVIMSREMPLTASLTQGDHDIGLAMQELDVEVLESVNERQLHVMYQLVDAATGHALAPEQLEQRGQVLIDLLLAVATSPRLNPRSAPWDEYADTLADVIVNGLTNPGAEAVAEQLLAAPAQRSLEHGANT